MSKWLRTFLTSIGVTAISLVNYSGTAGAAILLTNPSQFSGSETVLNFEGLTSSTFHTTIGGVEFTLGSAGALGGVQSSSDDTSARQFGPPGAGYVDNQQAGSGDWQQMNINLPGLVNRFAFESRTPAPDDIDITLKLVSSGDVVETLIFSSPTTSAWRFFGFETTLDFDQVVLDPENNNNGYIRIDNLRFENTGVVAPVPLPAALPFFVGALGIFGILGWRRKRKAAAA